jgi:hypothetical protein
MRRQQHDVRDSDMQNERAEKKKKRKPQRERE